MLFWLQHVPFHWQHAAVPAARMKQQAHQEKLRRQCQTQQKVIDVDLTSEEYAFGVDKTQPELLEQTNTFIQKIKDDGTLDAICAKYFGDDEPEAVESAELDSSKRPVGCSYKCSFRAF